MGDWSTNITSLRWSAPSRRSKAPAASVGLPKWRISAGTSTSWISVDLPEPLTPVMVTRRCSGKSTSMLRRLCSRAPSRMSRGVDSVTMRLRPKPHLLAAAQVGAGQRVGMAQVLGLAVEDDLAAARAGAGAHVDHAVGREHHGRVVLDHDQGVARIAQALHGLGDAFHVARVQADARLVEHEQGVDQRGAQGRGQVDALHLAARQRAALAVQREVADAHVAQVLHARHDFGVQHLERLGLAVMQWGVDSRRQLLKEVAQPHQGQLHQVVQAKARQRVQLLAAPGHAPSA